MDSSRFIDRNLILVLMTRRHSCLVLVSTYSFLSWKPPFPKWFFHVLFGYHVWQFLIRRRMGKSDVLFQPPGKLLRKNNKSSSTCNSYARNDQMGSRPMIQNHKHDQILKWAVPCGAVPSVLADSELPRHRQRSLPRYFEREHLRK